MLDATETGDLLPLTGAEYVTGFESQRRDRRAARRRGRPAANMQAVVGCFASTTSTANHTIDRPASTTSGAAAAALLGDRLLSLLAPDPRTLELVRAHASRRTRTTIPLSIGPDQATRADSDLWTVPPHRRARQLHAGRYASDITLVNWPQIDYLERPGDRRARRGRRHAGRARELSPGFLYWLQTEAPRRRRHGFPGLRLRGDVTGTRDGLAKAPYIRESRRIRAEYTVVEQDVSLAVRGDTARSATPDTVGIGMYRIDLHPSTGGDNYIDVACLPVRDPARRPDPAAGREPAAGGKNIGTTHITNGGYRLHPVEWNIGEAAGRSPRSASREAPPARRSCRPDALLRDLQRELAPERCRADWPPGVAAY